MKTIGILGGMSWQSTIPYYRILNESVRDTLGGLHSAKIILWSVDFAELEELLRAGAWDNIGSRLTAAAQAVERAGAEVLLIGTNTMHIVADRVAAGITIPLLHVVDATAAAITATGAQTVGLLGTRFTMEKPFYRDRLASHGLRTLTPNETDRTDVHRIVFEELCLGRTEEPSRQTYRRVIQDLVNDGAQAIIFGCTEIGLLIGQKDSPVPVFDTTELHAKAAARYAMAP
jgi:aspartate racemase